MLGFLFSSFALGIAYCAPPGIVTAETLRRGFSRGFWAALLVQLGSVVGDLVWATFSMTGLAFLVQNLTTRLIVAGLGILLLSWLAYQALRDAWVGGMPKPKTVSSRGDFATGVVLSLTNPFAIVFWVGLGSTALVSSAPLSLPVRVAAFFSAFLVGILLWCFMMAGLVTRGRTLITDRFFSWVNLFCGLLLIYFALQLGWNVYQTI